MNIATVTNNEILFDFNQIKANDWKSAWVKVKQAFSQGTGLLPEDPIFNKAGRIVKLSLLLDYELLPNGLVEVTCQGSSYRKTITNSLRAIINYEHDIHLNILPEDGIDPFEFQSEVWEEWANKLIENVTLLATNQ